LGGAIFIAFSEVQGKIDTITRERDTAKDERDTFEDEAKDANEAVKLAEKDKKKAQEDAEDAKTKYANVVRNLAVQTERADLHEKTSNELQAQLVQATTFVESWRLFQQANGTQDQIRQKLNSFREVDSQRAQFLAENGILLGQIEKLGAELARYTGAPVKVALPRTLQGKVTAVDAQFDFVVLDIGESEGAREHGELLVSRGEKLIGKLRILDVKEDHSIANILPDWKQGEIQAGDLVIVGN